MLFTQRLLNCSCIFLLIFFVNQYAFAQPTDMGTRPNMRMPSIGRVYGKVIDATTKKPVDYATITILATNKDSLIAGILAKGNGDFNLDKLPFGRFRLRIQFVGYKTYVQPVIITPQRIEQDLGDIKLEPDTKMLNDVVVEGDKVQNVITIDRRTYNVDKDISSRGGTAVDVMKNIPGLTVDADGNIALRNQSPTIFIDGRPTTLTLEQLPAEQIERVEVITNPSAKFDAGATGGIVNVVMKNNTKPGYNGMIGASIGTNNRYGVNANLNIKEGKVNFFVSYNLNARQNPARGFTNRTSLRDEARTGIYRQENNNLATNLMQFGRVGIDYSLNNRNTITLAQNIMRGNWNQYDQQTFSQSDGNNIPMSTGTRLNDQQNQFRNYTTQLLWKRTYPKQGKEWITDISYNLGRQKSDATFTTTNYLNGNLLPNNPEIQLNDGSGRNNIINFQYDYVNPTSDSSKFEWGVKSYYRQARTGLIVDNYNYPTATYLRDTFLTSDYLITDIINAAYINYSGYLGSIGYQAGLRMEQTNFRGELVNKNQTFEYVYPDGAQDLTKALFPSLFFSKKVNAKNEVQLNFSRKINRPDRMQIMPFIMFSDKLNYQIGNPALAPEFINLAEANYNTIWGNGSWLTSFYGRYQQNPITQYVFRSQTDTNVLITSFINGQANISYGWENTVKWSFFNRKLDVTLNGNVFYINITANTTSSGTLQNSGYTWNTKANISYKLPLGFTAQVNGSYEAPRIIPQGKTIPVYSVDFSLNKDVSKKLSLNFTINDVFNTRRFGSQFDTEFFTQDLSRRRDVRFYRIGFVYRFGEWDASLFRKRKANKEGQGGSMDMDF
jgi:hypothetical protein